MRRTSVTTPARKRAARTTRTKFALESLERRELLTAYTVNTTSDTDTPGTLRYVINQVNGDSVSDEIDFAIPGTGPQTITLGSPLPAITNSVFINGTTQNGTTGPPQVVLSGASLSSSDAALSVSAASSTIEDLAIVGCPGQGIVLSGAGDDQVEGCYIGTSNGTSATPNDAGIEILGGSGDTIGGTTAGSGNVISGNTNDGIDLDGYNNIDGSDVLIEGNIIGLMAVGTRGALQRRQWHLSERVRRHDDRRHDSECSQLISGNNGDGISLGTGIDSLVEGNYLGTDITGMVALANGIGINFTNASYATIGGTVQGAGNLISGNTRERDRLFRAGLDGRADRRQLGRSERHWQNRARQRQPGNPDRRADRLHDRRHGRGRGEHHRGQWKRRHQCPGRPQHGDARPGKLYRH